MENVVQPAKLADPLHCSHISGAFDHTDHSLVSAFVRTDATGVGVGEIAADGAVPHGIFRVNNGLGNGDRLAVFQ